MFCVFPSLWRFVSRWYKKSICFFWNPPSDHVFFTNRQTGPLIWGSVYLERRRRDAWTTNHGDREKMCVCGKVDDCFGKSFSLEIIERDDILYFSAEVKVFGRCGPRGVFYPIVIVVPCAQQAGVLYVSQNKFPVAPRTITFFFYLHKPRTFPPGCNFD